MSSIHFLDSFFSNPFFHNVLFGNEIVQYIYGFFIFLLIYFVLKIFHRYVFKKIEKLSFRTNMDIDDMFVSVIKKIRPSFYLYIAFYFSIKSILVTSTIQGIINAILILFVVYQIMIVLHILVDYILRKKFNKEEEDESTIGSAVYMIGKIIKFALWVFAILLVLSNLGINVTSLIAGLGIGGVAIALALQNILGDLFSSFAIYFDKPFKVGDFIVVYDKSGVVEKIGIKTTRIKALQGEEIVISNRDLVSAKIQNFKKMKERRVVFSFGVAYETPTETVRQIPSMISEIINSVSGARFDRSHFYKFDDSALSFETIYYIENSDYNTYMDINQEIHLRIKKLFDEKSISIAYPTRTIYMKQMDN